jgi:hypothetical protein
MQLLDEILQTAEKLTDEQQRDLLNYARALTQPLIKPSGDLLIEHQKDFHFEPGELDLMLRVIEEDCERIDWDAWK